MCWLPVRLGIGLLFVISVARCDELETLDLPQEGRLEVHIGGFFDYENSTEEKAFLSAINYVNRHKLIAGHKLVGHVSVVPPGDSFQIEQTFCQLIEEGVLAVVGPASRPNSGHLQSLCDALEVPHMTTSWDPWQKRGSCRVNLYPHPPALAEVLDSLVLAWNWKGFTILYDNYDALLKIQDLLTFSYKIGSLVTVRQLVYDEEMGYRQALLDVKYSGETNIVLECSIDILEQVLTEAQQVGLMGIGYSYIISNLDFQTIDYNPFKWSRTNITALRMVNPENSYVVEMASDWENLEEAEDTEGSDDYQATGDLEDEEEEDEETTTPTTPGGTLENNNDTRHSLDFIPNVESALTHDAVILLAQALDHLSPLNAPPLKCYQRGLDFKFGYSLVNYIRLSDLEGMTGKTRFDYEGFRSELEVEVVEVTSSGLEGRGGWNGSLDLEIPPPSPSYPDDGEDLRNVSFTVLIALTPPYIMLKESKDPLTGNDRYEGFGVDLIQELSTMTGFNYTFKQHNGTSSGNPKELRDGTRDWDGLIGEVFHGRADLAISDISITNERIRDVDFTDPFLHLGITILYRKPTKAPPGLFAFLDPFSKEVWGSLMSVYVGISLLFFIMARLNPQEWTNPYPCIEEPEVLENQFSLANSFWFTVGSLMQQGSEIAPTGGSTRLLAAVWWFFTLTMVSSYTAQLASFLTVEIPNQPFKTVQELANQNDITYGAKFKGASWNFFRDSKDPTYQKIFRHMDLHNKTDSYNDNKPGVDRVLKEKKYAFFMESSSIEYVIERECSLTQVGGLLDNKGYGIVLRQNSTYRNVLSKNIVKLQENGKLQAIKNKWWKEKRGGGLCGKEADAAAEELTLAHTGGVFLVLFCGCSFGIFVAICEFLLDIAFRKNKVSFMEELKEDIKFIINCRQNTKPVRRPSQLSLSQREGLQRQWSSGSLARTKSLKSLND